ncbi:MAG: bifunctional folylpolyglutamate synthase/dihydrofolate synthase [Clostridiales bacterium]|jgi:dihydrofolate synthase/folylpolyglutamate synthase|nr:bifunctional folylpolyglutamate synthase/dihydrofolate synthase [Clostridiales bacterium]
MNLKQAQDYLNASIGRKKGLAAVSAALAALDNPQEQLKVIHVAGTNGKGSFCAMLGNVLKTAGFRAGVFTSPHLERLNERFVINGEQITDGDFLRILAQIIEISDKMYGEDDGFAFFEIFVLIAFTYFAEKSVDFLLLEVGIGGRLDATNVIKTPILSAIMAIGYDHMEMLGDTLPEIAREKGGIIKENCHLVLYDDTHLVYNIFREMAAAKNAKIYHARDHSVNALKIGLLGEHQRENARAVLAACAALRDLGVTLADSHIMEGLATARHPGRMEIIAENPMILLDGAHNLQGAMALAHNMETLFAGGDFTVILGILRDKDYQKIVNILTAPAKRIIFTKPSYDLKAVAPENLAKLLKSDNQEVFAVQSYAEALQLAYRITPTDGIILVTGSLYLVGDIRPLA